MLPPMSILSYVLRLRSTPNDDLAGEIESVQTGERTVVRSAEDLVAHLRNDLQAGSPEGPGSFPEPEPLTPA